MVRQWGVKEFELVKAIEKAREMVIRCAKKWDDDMKHKEFADDSTENLAEAVDALNKLESQPSNISRKRKV